MAYLDPSAGAARESAAIGELGTLGTNIPTAAVANVAAANADATYGAEEATLINELKTQLNALLAVLRTAGIITP